MGADRVDEGDVRHIADLARLELEPAEIETFVDQFDEILEWFEALDDVPAVDDDRVEGANVLRPDSERPCLEQADSLANASEREDGFFRGPPVG